MLEWTFIYLVARCIGLLKKYQWAGSPLRPAISCADKCPFPVLGFLSPSQQHHAQPSVRLAREEQGEGVAKFGLGKWCPGTMKGWCKHWALGRACPDAWQSSHFTPCPAFSGFTPFPCLHGPSVTWGCGICTAPSNTQYHQLLFIMRF